MPSSPSRPRPGARPPRARRASKRAAVLAVLAAAAVVSGCGAAAKPAPLPPLRRVTGPVSILNPSVALYTDPAGTAAQMHALGVVRADIGVYWSYLLGQAEAAPTSKPGFDATDPAAYPAADWAPLDTFIRDARAAGIGIDIQLNGPPPRWAEGRGAPHPATQTEWRPSSADFEQFVRAVGLRYSGHYIPPGTSKPLPRVDFWSIWNEPNIGANLAPESSGGGQVEVAPALYRGIVQAAWAGLHATGHGHDTILIGELAPAGFRVGRLGVFNNMPPIQFLRALYCVDSSYRPLTGTAAALRACPTTAAASKRFRAQNPGLFGASGVADHPYLFGLPPNQPSPGEPDYAQLPRIPYLARVLDTLMRVYGSTKRYLIYSTEYGYQTRPPDAEPGTVSPTTAAAWLNWSEYMSWLDWPRLRSYDQYLLTDPPTCSPTAQPRGHCYFASGIETWNGIPKPGFAALRMPIYLPKTATAAGHPLEVWGCVRPYYYARHQTGRPQIAQIQFEHSGGRWRTVGQVQLSDRYGYLDVLQRFPGSGQVRLTWAYPDGTRIFSRTVAITLH